MIGLLGICERTEINLCFEEVENIHLQCLYNNGLIGKWQCPLHGSAATFCYKETGICWEKTFTPRGLRLRAGTRIHICTQE